MAEPTWILRQRMMYPSALKPRSSARTSVRFSLPQILNVLCLLGSYKHVLRDNELKSNFLLGTYKILRNKRLIVTTFYLIQLSKFINYIIQLIKDYSKRSLSQFICGVELTQFSWDGAIKHFIK